MLLVMVPRLFINTIFIFSFLQVAAQGFEDNPYHPFFTLRNFLLAEDYLLGMEVGAIHPSERVTFFGSFDFRPFRKKVLNHQGGNLFYQNAEQRFFIGAGAEYLHYMPGKNYGVSVQINGNYTWAFYGGTEVKPPHGFVLNPKAGFFWKFAPDLLVKAGYSYQDTMQDRVGKNRLYVAFTGFIKR